MALIARRFVCSMIPKVPSSHVIHRNALMHVTCCKQTSNNNNNNNDNINTIDINSNIDNKNNLTYIPPIEHNTEKLVPMSTAQLWDSRALLSYKNSSISSSVPPIAALKSSDSKKTVYKAMNGQEVKDNILLYFNTILTTKPIRWTEPHIGSLITQKKPLKKHLAGTRRPAKVMRKKEKRKRRMKWLIKKLRKQRKRKFSKVSKGFKEGPASMFSIPLFRKGNGYRMYYSIRKVKEWKTKCLNRYLNNRSKNNPSVLEGFKSFALTNQPPKVLKFFELVFKRFGAHSGIVRKQNTYHKSYGNIGVLDERRTKGFQRGYLWFKMKYHQVKHGRMKNSSNDAKFRNLLRNKVWLNRLTRKEKVRQRNQISFLKLRGRKRIIERRKSFRADRKVVTTGGGFVNRKATKLPGIKKGFDKNIRRMSINIRMAEKGQRVRKR